MPRFASASARSLPSTPACPGTQRHSIWCRAASEASRCHRSRFFTGLPLAVFQPRFCHCASHSVMPSFTYCESVWITTWLGRFTAASASITAVSSIRLLVVPDAPP